MSAIRHRFDRELIRKYDKPGPRYTSYPTVPHFSADFGPEDYSRLLAECGSRPLSLYVHVPFCETRCLFCGCNVVIARDRKRALRYLDRVEREMQGVARLLQGHAREAVQMHWGGGTPTFLEADELVRLLTSLRRHFDFAPDCEMGVEVDPRHCSLEQLDALVGRGVNRLSFGVQDLAPEVQQAIRRLQPEAQTAELIRAARSRGVESINIDLIYGLPHQTLETFARTLDQVIAWSPDRLAVFNFAYLPSMFPHQRAIAADALPDPETKLSLLELTVDKLSSAGYVLIGMDHFARPDDPLARALEEGSLTRNFQGYSTCGETDLVALGATAISQVGSGYAQNQRELAEYESAIARDGLATLRGLRLSAEDRLRRDVIMRLMGSFRLDKREIESRHGIRFDRHFAAELESLGPLEEDGLVARSRDALEVTSAGRLLVRNVAMSFDAYLPSETERRYSRTV